MINDQEKTKEQLIAELQALRQECDKLTALTGRTGNEPKRTEEALHESEEKFREMADLLPQTIEQWEDGFQRQVDPAKEVALWLHMIAVLRECGKGEQLSHDQRMEIYLFVLKYSLCPAGSTDTILDAITPITISRETALKAMRLYDGEKPEEWHKSNIGRVE